MDIEIVTTKKKLTKSLLNQMRMPSKENMKTGVGLGFVIDVVKNCYKAILIYNKGEYYIISGFYKKGETSVYRKIGKWTQTKKFDSSEACDEWWQAYKRVVAMATTHIYI